MDTFRYAYPDARLGIPEYNYLDTPCKLVRTELLLGNSAALSLSFFATFTRRDTGSATEQGRFALEINSILLPALSLRRIVRDWY